jgi:inner membrane protein
MDNICHTLAGAALGEAGLKRRSGLAMATLMIGANLPDIDAVTVITGGSLALRRGMTHGVLAIVVLPLLLVALMMAWDRGVRRRGGSVPAEPVRPGQLVILAYLGVLSHPFLDWLNTYGIRLLMPFDDRWFYGDSLFIIDPWMWAVLGIGVWAARKASRARPARVALGLTAFYLVGMIGSAMAGRSMVERTLAQHGISGDAAVMVGPVPVNPFRRQVVVRVGDGYRFGTLTWRPLPDLTLDAEVLPGNAGHPLARLAADSPAGRDFLVWSRFPFFVVEEGPGGARVRIDDARYTRGAASSFARVVVEVDPPAR